MTWNESVREPAHKIYEVWLENNCLCSHWSTKYKALVEISKLSGIPKDHLKFKKINGEYWLIQEDGSCVYPGITIEEIEVDSGRYQ